MEGLLAEGGLNRHRPAGARHHLYQGPPGGERSNFGKHFECAEGRILKNDESSEVALKFSKRLFFESSSANLGQVQVSVVVHTHREV